MEIELTGLKTGNRTLWIIVLVFIGTVVILGVIGRAYSPIDNAGNPRLLTWTEWQVIQAERSYQAELDSLRQEADQLATMLNQEPDPVRAQINAERVARQYVNGQPALQYQRELVITAAQAVGDWAAGAQAFEAALGAVEQLSQALQGTEHNQSQPKDRAPYQAFLPLTVRDGTSQAAANPYPLPNATVRVFP